MCNWGKVGQIAVVRRVAVRAGQMDTIPSKGCRERERERGITRQRKFYFVYFRFAKKYDTRVLFLFRLKIRIRTRGAFDVLLFLYPHFLL